MIDIASLNNNLPTYFEALDSSNSNSSQSLLPSNRNERLPPQNVMGEQPIFNNNNNNVVQTIPNSISSNNILQQQTIIQQNTILQPSTVTLQNNSIQQTSNQIFPSNQIINTNVSTLPSQNQMNPPDLISQPSQPSPYSNNTIVSPLNGLNLTTPPQYVVVNKNNLTPSNTYISYPNASPPNMNVNGQMNVLPTPANNTIISPIFQSTNASSVMLPPSAVISQNTMNHAYSAPVFSNTLSPPSLPNQDSNAGIPINMTAIPSNGNTPLISTPHAINTTPIISTPLTNGILPSNINTPIISSNTPIVSSNTPGNIIPTDLSTPVISTDLTTPLEMATPIVMNTSMPVISNEMATPIQGSTTPAIPSGLFAINAADPVIAGSTNNSLVIPSDANSSIILESPQVVTLDSLSPQNKMSNMIAVQQKTYSVGTPVNKTTMDGLTPPTKNGALCFDNDSVFPMRTEEIPLLNIGTTPSTRTNEFINSLPTPTDSFTMKCTMNKEGITLDSIAENSVAEINKPVMPISPKEELSKLVGTNGNTNDNNTNIKSNSKESSATTILSNASYPSPQTVNRKGILKTPSNGNQILSQQSSIISMTNGISSMRTPMPTPMPTPLTTPLNNETSNGSYINVMPTPLATSMDISNGLVQDRRRKRVVKKSKIIAKELASPAVLSSISSVVSSLKAVISPEIPLTTSLKTIQEVQNSTTTVPSKVSVKTDPAKFTEPLTNEELLTLTDPQMFVDPLKNSDMAKSKTEVVKVEEQKKTKNEKEVKESKVVKEVKRNNNILTYTDLLKEATIQRKKLSFTDLLSDLVSSKTSTTALHKLKNYTEPLPYTDPLGGEEGKDDLLTLDDLINEASIQNKKVTFNDLLTEGNVSEQATNIKSENEVETKSNSDSTTVESSSIHTSNKSENVSELDKTSVTKRSTNKTSTPIKTSAKTSALIESIRKEFTFKKHSKTTKKEKKETSKSKVNIKKEEKVLKSSIKNEEVNGNEKLASIGTKRKENEEISQNSATTEKSNIGTNTINNTNSIITKNVSKKVKTEEKEKDESKEVKINKIPEVSKVDVNTTNTTNATDKTNNTIDSSENTSNNTVTKTKSSKKRSMEENSSKDEGTVVKKRKHKDGEQKKKNKESKHKDVSENGIINKVKYNSNNISLYDSELKSLLKYQTKTDEDVYPLRCICEGDYDEKDATLGLEDLKCSFPNCNKVFNKSIHLEKHFIEHGEDFRPFQCPNCTKNFRRRYDLMRHIRIHNYIIPYRCSRCLRGFTRSDSCARHTKTRQCKYFDFKNLGMKKDQPPYYSVVKDPEEKTEKEIVIVPLNKGSQ